MAKKKTKKRSPRRRSVSGVGSSVQALAMNVAGIMAGAFAANALAKMVGAEKVAADGTTPLINPKLLAAGQMVVGAFLLPKFVPGAMGTAVGNGMIAVGGIQLLQSMDVINGVGASHDLINGGQQLMISGADSNAIETSGDTLAAALISGAE